jgi:hypothetical protein
MNTCKTLRFLGLMLWSLWALCATLPSAMAGTPDDVAPPDWYLSPDGGLIIHRSARVAWPRCVEGMKWNGKRCMGVAMWLDHTEALALAQSREKAEGIAWRLPYLKELQQLARQNAQPGAQGPALLPQAGQGWCWTATTTIVTGSINPYSYGNIQRGLSATNMNQMKFLHGWAVNTASVDEQSNVLKHTKLMVRLVRRID